MAAASSSQIIVTLWKPFRSLEDVEKIINQWIGDPNIAAQNRYIALPYTYLKSLSEKLAKSGVVFGSDFLDPVNEHSFTRTIATRLLTEAGARFVLVGTAEKRRKFNETNAVIREKLIRAAKEKLIPFLCVGETGQDFTDGKSQEVIYNQLKECLDGFTPEQHKGLTIIYEAPWMDTYPYKPNEADLSHSYEQFNAALRDAIDAKFIPTLHLIYAYPYDLDHIPSYFQTHEADGYFFEKPIHYSDLTSYELHDELKRNLKEPHLSIAAPGILEKTGIPPTELKVEQVAQPQKEVTAEEPKVVVSQDRLDAVLDETISPVGEQVVKKKSSEAIKDESV